MAPLSGYRPNPSRSVYVNGVLDTDLLRRVTPEILSLQHQSHEPITVYIDSHGGDPNITTALLKLLKAPSQDGDEPCRIITVAVTNAYSAAADLLAFGDYALAFPATSLLYHGGRIPNAKELTAERSSLLAQALRITNETSAMVLESEAQFRFMFRFITSRSEFSKIRTAFGKPNMSDLDCLVNYVSPNVSKPAQNILNKARQRYGRYEDLLKSVSVARKRQRAAKTPIEIEAVELKAIVDFEVKQNTNNPDWSFDSGIHSLTDDFLLFRNYEQVLRSDRYRRTCARYGQFLVDDTEVAKIDAIADENERLDRWTDRVSPALRPIWSFFVALCHTLQQGDDEYLTATDAYWLGLIDEIIGTEGLMHLRVLKENVPPVTTAATATTP